MMNIRTHAEILESRRDAIRRRIADGYYEQDGVIDVAAELIAAEIGLTRSGCGRTLGEGLPAGSGFDSFPPSGDGVGRESAPRLAVAEPMQNFEATPVFTGHANELRDECDDVISTRARENEVADCLLWIACGVVVFLVLAVTA